MASPPASLYEPPPRQGHSLCEFNKKLYLVGGKGIPTTTVDIFDPATLTWKQEKTTEPAPSSIDCSAYTVLDQQAFFFGGRDKRGGRYHNNLWVLDLMSFTWKKIQQNGQQPAARYNAGLVGSQDKLVLYGGLASGHTFNDIHEFNLKDGTWTLSPHVSGKPPPPMLDGFTFTQVGKQAVLFGRNEGKKTNTNDVYTLDIDKRHWTKMITIGTAQPRGRYCHAACAIGTTHLLVTGGRDGHSHTYDDSWILDLQLQRWRKVELPANGAKRTSHAVATVVTDEGAQVLSFGGYDDHAVVAATAVLSLAMASPYEPLPRWGHSVFQFNKKFYLVGGKDVPTSSVDIFDPATLTWTQEKTKGPTPSSIDRSACTVVDHQAFFFGGRTPRDDYHNNLWALDLMSLRWKEIPQKHQWPSARRSAGLVGNQDMLVLFGGLNRGRTFNDIQLFDLKTGTWTTPRVTGTPPPPNLRGFTFTQVGRQAVLFGGRAWSEEQEAFVNDVYTLDLEKGQWTKKTTFGKAQPHGRYNHAACAIGTTHLLVSGGCNRNGQKVDDLWMFDLQLMRWREVEIPGDHHRWYHAIAGVVSTEEAEILYFGGKVVDGIVAATALFSSNPLQLVSPSTENPRLDPPPSENVDVVNVPLLFSALSSTSVGEAKEWSVEDYITTDHWRERVKQKEQQFAMASPPDPQYEPPPRQEHAVCQFNKKFYLVGGKGMPTSSIDIFDPATRTWKQKITKGVAPTSLYTSAYTVVNQQAFFFGERDEKGNHNNLWALDLLSLNWMKISQKGQQPSIRHSAGLVGYQDMLVLFGGLASGHTFNDVHVFNLKDGTWKSQPVTGIPPELIGFTITRVGQQAVVFGGHKWKEGREIPVNDVYTLDLEMWHWTKKAIVGTAQPCGRYHHAACAIGTTHLLVTGGRDGQCHTYDDSWILNLQLMRWRKVEVPVDGAKRMRHAIAAVVTAEEAQILYFGGFDDYAIVAATAVMSLAIATPYEPLPRRGHSVFQFNKKFYLVGGKDVSTSSVDIFDPATLTWKQEEAKGPTPSCIDRSACAVVDHQAFFFGGRTARGDYHNNLWALDLISLKWKEVPQKGHQPSARCNAGLVAYHNQLIIYGGLGRGHTFNDIYFFNLNDGTWTSPHVTGTPPSVLSGFTFTQVGHQAMLFGGREWSEGQEIYANDVYTLDLEQLHWTKNTTVGTAQPSGRSCHAVCAIDTTHLLVAGGSDGHTLGDLWILDIQSMRWKEVELSGGGAGRWRHAIAAVVTTEAAQILYFGGCVGDEVVAASALFVSALPLVSPTTKKPRLDLASSATEELINVPLLFTALDNAIVSGTKEWIVLNYMTIEQWREKVQKQLQPIGESVPDEAPPTKEPWVPCFTSVPCIETPSDAAGSAPCSHKLRWEKKQLKVHFMNRIPTWRWTTPPNDFIGTTDILKWANAWSSKELGLNGIVPEFVPCRIGDESESDIRVQFKADVGSWSYIGTNAQSYQDKPTMVLDLAKEDDDYRQYTVTHEFGHTLGLGHEHQTSRLAGAIDEEAMLKYLQGPGVNMTYDQARKKFDTDYSETSRLGVSREVEFDPLSVMCYPIPPECVKKSYRHQFTSYEFSKMTTPSYNQRKTLSSIDIKTIKELYLSGEYVPDKVPSDDSVSGEASPWPVARSRMESQDTDIRSGMESQDITPGQSKYNKIIKHLTMDEAILQRKSRDIGLSKHGKLERQHSFDVGSGGGPASQTGYASTQYEMQYPEGGSPLTGNAPTQYGMQYPGAGGGGGWGHPMPYPQHFGGGGVGQVPQIGNAPSQFRMQYPGASGTGWRGHPMPFPQQFATDTGSGLGQPLPATPSFLQQHNTNQQLHSLSSKPQLHELQQFRKKEGGTILLIRRVAYQWKQIALALQLDGSTIARVEKDYLRETESACIRIFALWLEGRGQQPVNWSTLIEALDSIELTEISQELKAQFM